MREKGREISLCDTLTYTHSLCGMKGDFSQVSTWLKILVIHGYDFLFLED